jgi:hypothetical protein
MDADGWMDTTNAVDLHANIIAMRHAVLKALVD